MNGIIPFYQTFKVAIDNCWPMLVLFIVIITISRISKIIIDHEKFIFHKEFYKLLVILYFLLLYYMLLSTEGASSGFNIVPFTEMTRYALWSKSFFYNVIGNIVLFIPFGFIISWYLNNEKCFQIGVITFIISLTAELIQYCIGRAFDIDDIILNVLGGVIGFIVFNIIKSFNKKLPNFLKNDLFYNLIAIIVFIGIILLFALVWGLI